MSIQSDYEYTEWLWVYRVTINYKYDMEATNLSRHCLLLRPYNVEATNPQLLYP